MRCWILLAGLTLLFPLPVYSARLQIKSNVKRQSTKAQFDAEEARAKDQIARLSLMQRQTIYYEIGEARTRAQYEADRRLPIRDVKDITKTYLERWAKLSIEIAQPKEAEVARKYGLNATAMSMVRIEGLKKDWATPRHSFTDALIGTEFDITVKKLPVPFKGSSVEDIFMTKTVSPKGEFETNGDYERRLSAFRSSTYAFVPSHNHQPSFEYDPNIEFFSVRIRPDPTQTESRSSWDFRAFNIHRIKLSESQYVGQNAFGATTVVTKRVWQQTQLVTGESDSTDDVYRGQILIDIPIPRDKARIVKPQLSICFVCSTKGEQFPLIRQVNPAPATGLAITHASLDSPQEDRSYYLSLRVKLVQIWIYNNVTGEIYGRYGPDGERITMQTAH